MIAAEASAAAAEEAQLTGKQEARQAGEGERAALEADLIQAREQLAQNKESASAQGALIEQARHEAAALVAKSEAAAAAAVAAAEEEQRDVEEDAKKFRGQLSTLEAKVMNLEAELAAERMMGGGGLGGGGGDGAGDILADANAAAASEMLKSVQEEREALRTELAENKARAAQRLMNCVGEFSRLMPTWRRPPRRSSLLRICARRLRRSCGRRRRRLMLRSCRLRQ